MLYILKEVFFISGFRIALYNIEDKIVGRGGRE